MATTTKALGAAVLAAGLSFGLAACQPPPADPAWRGTAARPAEFTVDGEIVEMGPKCPLMRGGDGALYGLRGPMDGFGVGDRVQARLRAADFDYCFNGLTVWVVSLEHP
jgi:hypothetical protein